MNRFRQLSLLVGLVVAGVCAADPELLPVPRIEGPELLPGPRVESELLPIPHAELPDKLAFAEHIKPFFATYCVGCHGGPKPKGKLALDKYADESAAMKDRKVWEHVAKNLRSGEMPPADKPKPRPDDIARIADWVESQLARVDCTKEKDPGRVTIRRLNRAEYNNTIRDLMGVDFQPAAGFPSDDVGYGFDNIGDVLSLPPLLLEKYLAAAEKIVAKAWEKPETRQQIMFIVPTADTKIDDARRILSGFGRRAYRRPLESAEVDRLLRFVELAEKRGDSFDKGIQLAVQAMLVSPYFLFRIEQDRTPSTPGGAWPISEHELAVRLSYFLWSSMPDDELFRLARKGSLRQELLPQVRRMLADPKAKALTENFAGQWLQLRSLPTLTPNTAQFPTFNNPLRTAMQRETELFFETIVREDRSILDFIDADFTFVNERLAKHYGMNGVKGDEFRRVQLTGTQRGGILTHASVLTVTSNPTRTSPVKRGKWIMENILGTPPREPPPDVPELKEDKEVVLKGSLRQRMEQHRANPACAVCHQQMDALGFAFENFDAVGAWRTKDGKFAIDPAGELPDGQKFAGPAELKQILKKQVILFSRCLSEKMLTYALGRGLEYYDRCAVDDIVGKLQKADYKFSALVIAIVQSDPFQMRRAKRGDQ